MRFQREGVGERELRIGRENDERRARDEAYWTLPPLERRVIEIERHLERVHASVVVTWWTLVLAILIAIAAAT